MEIKSFKNVIIEDKNENFFNDKKQKRNSMLKNKKGFVTISFILVLFIILYLIISFFGLAMTFAHVSVSQYMAYSTSRKLSLGGERQADQKNIAANYYRTLRAKFFRPGIHAGNPGGWFKISEALNINEQIGFAGGYDESNPYRWTFYGAGVSFQSFITEFRIPGLVKNKIDVGLIPSRIISFLGREPSTAECQTAFNEQRGQKICDEYSSYCESSVFVGTGEGDNGC